MEKRLNLRIHEMMTDLKKKNKNIMDSIVVRLKVKEIYGHVIQIQENGKPFSANILL